MRIDKLILQTTFLDENLGRLFLSYYNLKEAKDIETTIGLTDLQKRMSQFDNYIDFDYIKKEVKWSLSQVIKIQKQL